LAFDDNVNGHLGSAGKGFEGSQRCMRPDLGIARNRAREPHLVEAVVHLGMDVADSRMSVHVGISRESAG